MIVIIKSAKELETINKATSRIPVCHPISDPVGVKGGIDRGLYTFTRELTVIEGFIVPRMYARFFALRNFDFDSMPCLSPLPVIAMEKLLEPYSSGTVIFRFADAVTSGPGSRMAAVVQNLLPEVKIKFFGAFIGWAPRR